MEFLEQQAIATAPLDCRPKLWKRYVDDVLEIIRKGQVQNLTEHLNKVDTTGSIQFTHEAEEDGKIPFLDTLIVRQPDGSVKLLVYRKKAHTDRYLQFDSHHPLQHKYSVIRTLLERCNSGHSSGGQNQRKRTYNISFSEMWVPEMGHRKGGERY
ncbi:uncharacterized protein LOC128546467 [Mercenaria mercenaria]|uniref:uncharacterized protein LOC128546467 n=1 Tax=Mercenaria mercenaria TaxID=6596 RepID=UPI00234E7748|nr:uncharacterized protein LOC128546467 [Mercenaria mercenaria]